MEQNLISQRRPGAGLLLLSSGADPGWPGRGLLVLHRKRKQKKERGFYIADGNASQYPCLGFHAVFENPVPHDTRCHEERFAFKSCCPFLTPRRWWTRGSPPGTRERFLAKWVLSQLWHLWLPGADLSRVQFAAVARGPGWAPLRQVMDAEAGGVRVAPNGVWAPPRSKSRAR